MHGCEACNKEVHAARGYRRHRLEVFRAALGPLLAGLFVGVCRPRFAGRRETTPNACMHMQGG